jgi:hypothetical protein
VLSFQVVQVYWVVVLPLHQDKTLTSYQSHLIGVLSLRGTIKILPFEYFRKYPNTRFIALKCPSLGAIEN